MAHWIVQANPKQFDIDSALQNLETIRWRVPQYTDEIRRGDSAIIWRSGSEAGIVGVGTFTESPRLAPVSDDEVAFVLDDAKEGMPETRADLAVKATSWVPKHTVVGQPALSAHQIIRAPMGTVFRVSPDEWAVFASLLTASPPELTPVPDNDGLPEPWAWSDRLKDAYPMPGGYDDYLDSLRTILLVARDQRWTLEEFAKTLRTTFDLSKSNARHAALFLRRAGFIHDSAGHIELSRASSRFVDDGSAAVVIAQLHSRVRLIGELLALLDKPHSADELLDLVNDRYGMRWTTKAQIQRRRGWLQSAGAIAVDEDRRFVRTDLGTELLSQLKIYLPESVTLLVDDDVSGILDGAQPDAPVPASLGAAAIVDRLNATARDSASPDDFEFALRDAFDFLGFRAEKLGGAGKTDVLVDADLGRTQSYRIIVDGKTTNRGTVADNQIDWDTITDHRERYEADYVIVAGPDFGGDRVYERAARHSALLMTVNDIADLVEQHDNAPISLLELRSVFESESAEVDLDGIADAVESRDRVAEIAAAVLDAAEENVAEVGPVTARDLYLLLRKLPDLKAQEDEINEVLVALSSPLIRALVEVDEGFIPGEPRRTLQRRLDWLRDRLM